MKSIVYFVLIKLTYLNMTALNCSTTKGSLPSLILHISYGYNPKRNCRSFCSKNCNSLWSWELKVCGFNLRFYTTLGTHFLVLVHISVRFILSICGLGQINQQGKKKSFAYTWGTRELLLLLLSSTTSFTWFKGGGKKDPIPPEILRAIPFFLLHTRTCCLSLHLSWKTKHWKELLVWIWKFPVTSILCHFCQPFLRPFASSTVQPIFSNIIKQGDWKEYQGPHYYVWY